MTVDQNQLRLLPSVDELLHSEIGQQLTTQFSHTLAVRAIRAALTHARTDILAGIQCPSHKELLTSAEPLC